MSFSTKFLPTELAVYTFLSTLPYSSLILWGACALEICVIMYFYFYIYILLYLSLPLSSSVSYGKKDRKKVITIEESCFKKNSYGWLYTGMIFAVQHQINTTATQCYIIFFSSFSVFLHSFHLKVLG